MSDTSLNFRFSFVVTYIILCVIFFQCQIDHLIALIAWIAHLIAQIANIPKFCQFAYRIPQITVDLTSLPVTKFSGAFHLFKNAFAIV